MYVRIKKSGKHKYLQIVKSVRRWDRNKQIVIASLGNLNQYTKGMLLFDIGHSLIDLYEKLNPKPATRAKKKKAA